MIAVAGIAVVLVMMPGSSEPAKTDGKRKESARIREVTPAPAPKAKVAPKAKEVKEEPAKAEPITRAEKASLFDRLFGKR